MAEINLETKLVGGIKGNFYVPDYQRGFRWGKNEVETLLNDINEYGGRPRKSEKKTIVFNLLWYGILETNMN